MPLAYSTSRDRDRPDTLLPFFTPVDALSAAAGISTAVLLSNYWTVGWPVEWAWLPSFFAVVFGLCATRPIVRGRTPLDRARARLHGLWVMVTRKRVDLHD